jgi:hypothetical protein
MNYRRSNISEHPDCGWGPHRAASLDRRTLLGAVAAVLAATTTEARANIQFPPALPSEVAGIAIPRSALALRAAAFARNSCPEFLFNHCMRTFLFGAVHVERLHLHYDSDAAFAAAALHDCGLLQAFESRNFSFEVDGANNAEAFMRRNGAPPAEATDVWDAIAMHAMRTQIAEHQSGAVMLVGAGAGADFGGPDPEDIDAARTREIIGAFPRLQFKKKFLGLLTDHCRRKPLSQRATWLQSFCMQQVPSARFPSIVQALMDAPFEE